MYIYNVYDSYNAQGLIFIEILQSDRLLLYIT